MLLKVSVAGHLLGANSLDNEVGFHNTFSSRSISWRGSFCVSHSFRCWPFVGCKQRIDRYHDNPSIELTTLGKTICVIGKSASLIPLSVSLSLCQNVIGTLSGVITQNSLPITTCLTFGYWNAVSRRLHHWCFGTWTPFPLTVIIVHAIKRCRAWWLDTIPAVRMKGKRDRRLLNTRAIGC